MTAQGDSRDDILMSASQACAGAGDQPVSIQLIAKPFAAATLFQAGHAYEMAIGTRKRRAMMAMAEAAE